VLRSTAPCIVLDVPHIWTGWAKRTLVAADDIPDRSPRPRSRPNLRNTKNLMDLLARRRGPKRQPSTILPQHGRRAESGRRSKPADFAKALESEADGVESAFEPQSVRHRREQRAD